jgi:hypothetical protein
MLSLQCVVWLVGSVGSSKMKLIKAKMSICIPLSNHLTTSSLCRLQKQQILKTTTWFDMKHGLQILTSNNT